jgi:uncharacterized protein (TIGR02145 family)
MDRYYGMAIRCISHASAPTSPNITVNFDGAPATDVVVSEGGTKITATAPAHAAGTVQVMVGDGAESVAGGYTYYEPMTIDSLTPEVGPTAGGTVVEIEGNFPKTTPTMQEMTQEYCESLPIYDKDRTIPDPASTVELSDERDGTKYTVRRLQDGNCWMIDNLKFELTDGMELKPEDTNVVNNTTVNFAWDIFGGTKDGNFVVAGSLTKDGIADTTSPKQDAWRQVDPSTTAECANGTAFNSASLTGCGYLYNYYTAVAGSATQTSHSTEGNTAQGSICPAGWRLPHAFSGSADDNTDTSYTAGDYAVLYASMINNTLSPGITTGNNWGEWAMNGGFRTTLAGYYYNVFQQTGIYGEFWTSSVLSSAGGRNLLYKNNDKQVNPGNGSGNRNNGMAVRCVSDGGTDYNPDYETTTVELDGVPATNVSINSARTKITATTPAHASGEVVVEVSNGSTSANSTFTYYDPVKVSDITPAKGLTGGGTRVEITGDFPKPPATTLSGDDIQTVSEDSCPTDDKVWVVDARDDHTYWIQKLADGKCWMLTNLAYSGDGDNSYGDVKTVNLSSSGSSSDEPRYYELTGRSGFTQSYTTNPATPSTATNGLGQYGYLYNWCAAMGGQSEACQSTQAVQPAQSGIDASICPAGWRLPTGDPGGGEFEQLFSNHSSNIDRLLDTWLGVYSGQWTGGVLDVQGTYGRYWSSTFSGSSSARFMSFSSGLVLPSASADRYYGYAVRCVVDENKPIVPTVLFDGIPATDVSISPDRSTLYATTPTHDAAYVDVKVDNGVSHDTLKTAYMYYSPLIIDRIEPSIGLTTGDEVVKITGSGFTTPSLPVPTTMQEMSQAYCSTMAVGDMLSLPDTRDSEVYDVRKLADGNCWMVDNLRLGSKTGTMILTDEETDLNNRASFTLPQLYPSGDPSMASATSPYTFGPSPADDGSYGYYYNWTAAVAEDDSSALVGNGENAPNSICPIGWRLPRGSNSGVHILTNDFDFLSARMAGFDNNLDPAYHDYGNYMYHTAGWTSPSQFNRVLAGSWKGINSSFDTSGTQGSLWSSTVNDSPAYADIVYFSPSGVFPDASYERKDGVPVRCMQDGSSAGSTGLSVEFDGLDVSQIVSSSDTEIIVRTPAHTAGLVDVAVDNGITSDTAYGGYFYYDAMTITAIDPDHGLTDGGTNVEITGTNFGIQPVVFTQVSSGSDHTLALDVLGNLYAWGLKSQGALGIGGTSSDGPIRTPTKVNGHIESGIPLSTRFIKIEAGNGTSYAIDTDGNLYAWGIGTYGQMGNGGLTNVRAPTLVAGGDLPAGTKFADVSAGSHHVVALSADGKVYTWGLGLQGQMGDGTNTENNRTPKLVQAGNISPTTVIRSITAGGYHTMAIDVDGNLYAWGENVRGQIGNGASGSGVFVLTPWRVNGGAGSGLSAGTRFKAMDSGVYHTLAVDVDGGLWSWGENENGQIGNGSTAATVPSPYLVDSGALFGGTAIREVEAGGHHSFVIAADGSLYAWGSDDYGEIGNGSVAGNVLSPQLVEGGSVAVGEKFIRASANQNNSSAIDQAGRLYTWGRNRFGQIGNGLAYDDASYNVLSPWNLAWNYDFTVNLGGSICVNLVIVSATKLTCTTTPHVAGWVDVVADNGITTAILPLGYEYQDPYIKLSSDKLGAYAVVSPTVAGATASDHLTLTTETNWLTGFSLDVKQGTAGSSLSCSSGASAGTLLPATTDSVSVLDMNSWGLGVGTSSSEPALWRAVSPSLLNLDSLGTNGSKTTHLYYSARMNYDQPACSYYEGTVIITAVVVP